MGTYSDLTGIRTGLLASRCHRDEERDVSTIPVWGGAIVGRFFYVVLSCVALIRYLSPVTERWILLQVADFGSRISAARRIAHLTTTHFCSIIHVCNYCLISRVKIMIKGINRWYPGRVPSEAPGPRSIRGHFLLFAVACCILVVSLASCTLTEGPIAVSINCLQESSARFKFALEVSQPVTTCTWNFGDGHTSSDLEPSHVFVNRGIYTVNVNVFDEDGRHGWTSVVITAGHDWYVPRDGDLQDVVDRAIPHDTVFVTTGSYSVTVTKDLDMRSEGGQLKVVLYEGANGSLKGFTIFGDEEDDKRSALTLVKSSPTIIRCVFSGSESMYGAGVYALESGARFEECTFSNNWAHLGGGAVYAVGTYTFPSFDACKFRGNRSDAAGGALLFRSLMDVTLVADANLPCVSSCIFVSNTARQNPGIAEPMVGGAIHVGTGCRLLQRGNTFVGNIPADVIYEDLLGSGL